MKKLLLAFLFTIVFTVKGDDQTMVDKVITGDFWKSDKVIWGDGRPLDGEPSPQNIPHGFKSDWKITVPETGWYELYLPGAGGNFAHDVYLNGEVLYLAGSTDKQEKARNLWLEKGKHGLRIQRVGRSSFPKRAFKHFEFRRSDNKAENAIFAAKTLVDVVRAGEDLVIEMTGGGTGQEATYELFSQDQLNPKAPAKVVTKVIFPPGNTPETKKVTVKCPEEGAFKLGARVVGGRDLTESEFPIGYYAVIDVKGAVPDAGKPKLIYEIDCVKQTLNGKAIPKKDFIECNGPSRITKSKIGEYRESHDCTPPEAPKPGSGGAGAAKSFSGFSYKLTIPEVQVPYLLEVEYPDNDQRSMVMGPQWLNPRSGKLSKLSGGYNCKSVQTGGLFPLSNQMHTHRAVFWSKTASTVLTMFSQEIGTRAAVSKIRLYRFPDNNLPLPKVYPQGRNFFHWYEEAHNWAHLVGVSGSYRNPLVRDLVGLQRWAQFIRYHGGSGMSALGVGYQGSFWRNTHLEGFQPMSYDSARLAALICEKYGIKYLPEIFPNQWYMNKVVLPGRAEKPEDIRSVSCNGAERGPGAAACDLNPLHPEVQNIWLKGLGELADKLRDCKSFEGVSLRANVWQFRGDFTYPGLGWGYSDWTMQQFEKDTGIKVPGDISDPNRFMVRFQFLTSPKNLKKWVDWRCQRLLKYHTAIRDRIRGDRPEIKLVIWGSFRSDPVYKVPEDTLTRMRHCGIDLKAIQQAGGIAIVPAARYGSRYTTSQVQNIYDDFFDVDYVRAGMGDPRGFGSYMTYLELAKAWPAEKLGLPLPENMTAPPYHCSASLGAGRNSLEKYAVVLAEQDSSLLQEGGNADCFGDAELWRKWFGEYRALPALPFTALDGAKDPVAVWYSDVKGKTGIEDGTYFYAVNRSRWPVAIQLQLAGADSIASLTEREVPPLTEGNFVLYLEPYELRSFKTVNGADLKAVATTIPEEMRQYIYNRMAFAQNLRQQISAGAVPKKELAVYDVTLAKAWEALEHKAYWRARSLLRSAPMMRVYELTGAMPEGQIVGKFPNLMRPVGNMGHWNLLEPMLQGDELAAMVVGKPKIVSSNSFNQDWGGYKVIKSDNGKLTLEIKSKIKGNYTLQFGLVSDKPVPVIIKAGGNVLPFPAEIKNANLPGVNVFSNVALKVGKQQLVLTTPGGEPFGLYGLKVLPQMQPISSAQWSVVGPFKSFWGHTHGRESRTGAAIKKGMEKVYPPEKNPNLKDVYKNVYGQELKWNQSSGNIEGKFSDRGVNMAVRAASPGKDFNFALTYIYSDRDQSALLMLPCDWWARAYINGKRIKTDLPEKDVKATGADYTTWYPRYQGVLKLKKGENKLLIKQQGGSLGSGFASFISNLPGLEISATPKK